MRLQTAIISGLIVGGSGFLDDANVAAVSNDFNDSEPGFLDDANVAAPLSVPNDFNEPPPLPLYGSIPGVCL